VPRKLTEDDEDWEKVRDLGFLFEQLRATLDDFAGLLRETSSAP
jgi:hypothetical protein